ncbi:unnamed protein product [Nippostrongylus brasiliensis]|uniref:Uncharacterized protein n=1 Tax=Nippostrongylus brasiliensis TaxID=27835 RepID=A0A0N4YYP1_NIPBR|nr:unnamed protein product [Nippostrongylus brasiliensis]
MSPFPPPPGSAPMGTAAPSMMSPFAASQRWNDPPPPMVAFPHCWEDIQSIIAADEKRG